MAYIDITTRVYSPGGRNVTEKLAKALAAVAVAAVKAEAEKKFGRPTRVVSGYRYAYVLFAKEVAPRTLKLAKKHLRSVG